MIKFISKILFLTLPFMWVGNAVAQFPYQENFKGATAQNMVFGGSALLTAGSGIDSPGAGYLRLTNNSANQTGFARNTTAFPSAGGFEISFDYYTYGGTGADGIVFFLFDSSASPTFQIGAFGGSLGYAQRTDQGLGGLSKAFIGFAFDEFGNFGTTLQGRQGGGSVRTPSSISLRGDGDGAGAAQPGFATGTNYEYLTGIQTSNTTAMATAGAGAPFLIAGGTTLTGSTTPSRAQGLSPTNYGYRRAKIMIEPQGGNTFKINVTITENTSGVATNHPVISNYIYTSTAAIPANLSYGFASSTGGSNNFHEIRNLEISIPSENSASPAVSDVLLSGPSHSPLAFTLSNFTSSFSSPGNQALVKVQVVNLPDHGILKLNGINVTSGQEIPAADLSALALVPEPGFSGSSSFQWNGSDGFAYALSPASVTINLIQTSPFPYTESFKNSTAGAMLFGGSPNPAALTAGNSDPEGAGYLRLTSNLGNQKGFVQNTTAFPSEGGLSISFDYYTYGGSGADGISFFLYDTSAEPFNIGGFGGSLGYSQNNSSPGVSKAFLGIGLDEFGNFGNPGAGRQGGPGQRQSSVTLRGDGNGNAAVQTNYEYLTGIQTSNAAAMSSAGAGTSFQIAGGINGRTANGLSLTDNGYRKARIELFPNGSDTGYLLNVWITEGNASGGIEHHVITDFNYIPTDSIPGYLSYGFAGSTGGSTNFHEIRNLEISLPIDNSALPTVSDVLRSGPSNSPVSFTASDFTSGFSSPGNQALVKVRVESLPLHGILHLNGVSVTVGQEILAANLSTLAFVPEPGFSGSASFQWNGSNGSGYALAPASVTINLVLSSPFPYTESFKNATAGGMVFGGSPNSAALTAASGVDANGSGYLRLTNNGANQTGFARNTTAFPSAGGFEISFDYYTYGGTGADGIVFFLFDSSASPTFQIGGFGGSLGYAQRTDQGLGGLSKAFIGFAFDEFGNFSSNTQGRQGGAVGPDFGGRTPNSISLRGDGDGAGAAQPGFATGTNYEYLTGIQTSNTTAMATAGAGAPFLIAGGRILTGATTPSRAQGLSPTNYGYRRAKIMIEPQGGNTFKINVTITENTSGVATNHPVISNYTYTSTAAIPANLSYGFASSTGGSNNFHEIRNLEISIPSENSASPAVSDVLLSGPSHSPLAFTLSNFTSSFSSPGNQALVKVQVVNLPDHGILKLNGINVTSGQEIPAADLSALALVPEPGFSGSSSFQWNGSDGFAYALSPASVTINLIQTSPFPYTESFKNSTAGAMLFGGSPNPAALTAGNSDPEGAGYLRLTSNLGNQKGFVQNTTAFPSEGGLSISFDYYTYGGSGADGISFFLYDTSAEPFNIGGFGGSLGYSQNNSSPGVSKAFLGIGLDEFGNFGNPGAGRQGGPGQRQSSVTLRGDGNGNAAVQTNYEYLTGIQTSNAAAMSSAGAGTSFQIAGGINGRTANGLSLTDNGYRKARIELFPNGSDTGYLLNVWITEGNASGGIEHHVITDFNYIPTDSIPGYLSYGFAGSTGGSTNFHEIRNLEISLPIDNSALPTVSDVLRSGPSNSPVSFTASDFTSGFSSPGNQALVKVRVESLPLHGILHLNGVSVTVGQEILAANLSTLAFVPEPGFSGSASFQWNGSNGSGYALAPASVTINLVLSSPFPYTESFKNATAGGMVFGGSPNSAALTAASGVDANGSGYLRLTNNGANQTGFARNTTAFPSAGGFEISFDYYTYGGTGADGIVFFLFDSSASPTFQIGGFGGSLGYAQRTDQGLGGLSKAFIGFAFDEFGNFSSNTQGRQGGAVGPDFGGRTPNSISLRGDGDGAGAAQPGFAAGTNYEYLTGIQTSNTTAMATAGAGAPFLIAGGRILTGATNPSRAQGLSPTNYGYRRAKIMIEPQGGNTFKINVTITENTSGVATNHLVISNYIYTSTAAIPANLSYGFASSTGGSNNFHEIRNLEIRVPGTFEIPTMMTLKGGNFEGSVNRSNNVQSNEHEGKELSATNLFSPNGDGINDTWVIRNIDQYPNNIVRVFDRLGRLVYSASNYTNSWDGIYQGTLLPEDTYYYILDFSNEHKQMKGYISILR
jgi:gliding motility-associated-like protein